METGELMVMRLQDEAQLEGASGSNVVAARPFFLNSHVDDDGPEHNQQKALRFHRIALLDGWQVVDHLNDHLDGL